MISKFEVIKKNSGKQNFVDNFKIVKPTSLFQFIMICSSKAYHPQQKHAIT